ncbi:jg23742 [Pararge aegeria aegeria]|uniref:Jg23742 protein n=1 Tax=Pararge aegeria aegeria TaxID=348720 RepID=A0A8S4QY80_9NEOP|nr:jg23742 [Pararge aegeria aegeria]
MARPFIYTYFLSFMSIALAQDYYQTPSIGSQKLATCYNNEGQPQKCVPEFQNAAYNQQMEATNTCGENGVMMYCIQTSAGTSTRYGFFLLKQTLAPLQYEDAETYPSRPGRSDLYKPGSLSGHKINLCTAPSPAKTRSPTSDVIRKWAHTTASSPSETPSLQSSPEFSSPELHGSASHEVTSQADDPSLH